MYPAVSEEDILSLPFQVPPKEFERQVGSDVQSFFTKLQKSKGLYVEAEALLLDALGLDAALDAEVEAQRTYTQPASRAWSAGRLDAEYFQPHYYKMLTTMADKAKAGGYPIKNVGEITHSLKYGTSTKLDYLEEGVPFLRIADVENNRFRLESIKYISAEQAEEESQATVDTGDVLVSRSGTLGLAVAIPKYLQDAVFGSYFIRVEPKKEFILPEYLALFINSKIGQTQVERLNTGAIQTNLTITAIESIVIPVLPLEMQGVIVKKVLDSFCAEDEAHRLLEEAKRRVEAMILEG
jgi:hypothetical protein